MSRGKRHRTARPRCQRAFASFTAVVLVGTTALALAALARVTVHQARRANHAASDAQLRQLLIAGQAYLDSTSTGSAPSAEIALPEALANEDAVLTIQSLSSEGDAIKRVTLHATHGTRIASTTLIYDPQGKRWRVEAATLPN